MSWAYLEDASGFRGFADEVLIPANESELLEIVGRARGSKIPLTIAGAGSGITGGRCPEGGWLVSMEKFTRLEIQPGLAVCGAGVHLMDLHAAARHSGQFYPPDPTETLAAVGGTIACNASGSRSFKYGPTRRWIERLRVMLMDGRVLDVRRGHPIDFDVPEIPQPKACKHSAGYPLAAGMDWIDLFTGSEGTLGIVMETSLKLLPSAESILAGIVFFGSEDDALNALDAWRPVVGLRMLEYIDDDALHLIRSKYPEIPKEAHAALIIEQADFPETELDAWTGRMNLHHALEEASWFGSTDADRERFREFRHALPETVLAAVQQHKLMSLISDFAVPIDKHRQMLSYYRKRLSQAYTGRHVIYGHVGDGHYHVNLLPSNQSEFEQGRRVFDDFAHKAVEVGGSVAAEHGIGKRKREYLKYQYNPNQIDAMIAVKRRLDPEWLLGRGTLFEAPNPLVSALVVGPAVDLDSLLPEGIHGQADYAETAAQAITCLAVGRYDFVLINHTAEGDVTEEQLAYLRAAQAFASRTKFILLVSHSTTHKVIEALRHGMFAYFSRPFDSSAVQEAIRQALAVPDWSDGIQVISTADDFISVRLRCRLYTADRLTLFMKELPCGLSEEDRGELAVAFREMLLNAIEHGGKLDPDEWVSVSRVRTKRAIVYHIHDPGEGFSRADLIHAAIANPPDRPTAHIDIRAAKDMRPGGFGMLITSQLIDEVIYNQKGNEVILIKHVHSLEQTKN